MFVDDLDSLSKALKLGVKVLKAQSSSYDAKRDRIEQSLKWVDQCVHNMVKEEVDADTTADHRIGVERRKLDFNNPPVADDLDEWFANEDVEDLDFELDRCRKHSLFNKYLEPEEFQDLIQEGWEFGDAESSDPLEDLRGFLIFQKKHSQRLLAKAHGLNHPFVQPPLESTSSSSHDVSATNAGAACASLPDEPVQSEFEKALIESVAALTSTPSPCRAPGPILAIEWRAPAEQVLPSPPELPAPPRAGNGGGELKASAQSAPHDTAMMELPQSGPQETTHAGVEAVEVATPLGSSEQNGGDAKVSKTVQSPGQTSMAGIAHSGSHEIIPADEATAESTGKQFWDYSHRPRSIDDLRRFCKKSHTSSFADERLRAIQHPLFAKFLASKSMSLQQGLTGWAAGNTEKEQLQDLRSFLVWLFDTQKDQALSSTLNHGCGAGYDADTNLDEMSAALSERAEMDARYASSMASTSHADMDLTADLKSQTMQKGPGQISPGADGSDREAVKKHIDAATEKMLKSQALRSTPAKRVTTKRGQTSLETAFHIQEMISGLWVYMCIR